jgi:uncharacterized damage-inducible protein DinB
VQESTQTVESLGEQSDQIGTIIGTIEDIVWHLPMSIHIYISTLLKEVAERMYFQNVKSESNKLW